MCRAVERVYVPEQAPQTAREIRERGLEAVVRIQEGGRPLARVFALALAASFGDGPTRKSALDILPQIASTSRELFAFCEGCRGLRGWGRGLRRGLAAWYTSRPVDELESLVMELPAWEGWSHRDLLRLAHPVPLTAEHEALFAKIAARPERPIPPPTPMGSPVVPELDGVRVVDHFDDLRGPVVVLTESVLWTPLESPVARLCGRGRIVVVALNGPMFGELPDPDVLVIDGYGPEVPGLIADFTA